MSKPSKAGQASNDPTADSLAPPNMSAQAVVDEPKPPDDAGKIVDIGAHRHAGD
jgi:hypothetical protein